jgi:hypothetical protein
VAWDTVCSRWMSSPTLALLVAAASLAVATGAQEPSAAAGEATSVAEPGEVASPQPAEGTAIDPALRIQTPQVEPSAVQQGLELRVGEGWRRWTIEVDDGATAGQVDVRLRDRAGRVHARSLTLEGETVDERSRALASSLALLVEQLDETQTEQADPHRTEPAPPPTPRARPVAGFLAVGPRAALNPGAPLHVDVGASLVGGAWVARDHVMPVGELAWARSSVGSLTVDAIRMGGGVLGGAAGARGRLWGGGGALVRAQWARAHDSATATGWWASPAVVGAIQYRGRILVLGAWLGADLLLPPLRARGDAHVLRWSIVRPMASLQVGLRLPPRR